jgi:spore coat protein U-like protein
MKKAATGLLVLLTCFLADTVFAATATNNLIISASVTASCQITSVGNISFGAYAPLSGTPNDAAGNVVFRCVKGTSYKTYITGTRTMSGGSDTLAFQLYNETGRTTVFASNNSVSGTTSTGISPVTTNIYGRIAAGQDVSAASYTTTLITTVEY